VAISKPAKEEADLIRKVRIIDETLDVLSASMADISQTITRMDRTSLAIFEQLLILNKYMEEFLGDRIE
jgi:hypothetical protein